MQGPRVHPILLIGLLSLAASSAVGWLACPELLQGFFDGLGLVCLYGYLLALRTGRLGHA